tara:strand:+ start:324 stop:527 length:204 start_codon:yes stop_codon:yes gene_type:complete
MKTRGRSREEENNYTARVETKGDKRVRERTVYPCARLAIGREEPSGWLHEMPPDSAAEPEMKMNRKK